MKVSVIIPCYNQANFLDEALSSVLNQTHKFWECIIINDGSLDNTEAIAKKWLLKDERFKYYYKKNGGLSNARNFGLKYVNGECIQFLDADDLIESNKFELQLQDLKTCDISVSDYFSFIDGTNEKAPSRYLSPFLSEENYKKEIVLDWEYRKSIPCHSVLFKKKLIDNNAISFNESLPNHEDWVFWVKLFYFSNTIKNNQNVLALYRIHKTSMSYNYNLMRKGFLQATIMIQKFFKEKNENELYQISREKYNEVYNKNRVSLIKKIKSKAYLKLAYFYRSYVKKN